MTFDVLFTLFVSTNYLPTVNETDEGTWRRLFLLHFPYRFRSPGQPIELDTDRPGDANLKPRLRRGRGQHQAILAWLVEGAQMWYKNDRQFPKPDPERIEKDRTEWRKKDDSVWRFIEEELEFDADAHIMSQDLFQEFNRWLALQGHRAWGDKTFSDRFDNHWGIAGKGVVKKRIRQQPGLSRPSGVVALGSSSLPAQYQAWFGLRFRNPAVTFEMGSVRPVRGSLGPAQF